MVEILPTGLAMSVAKSLKLSTRGHQM